MVAGSVHWECGVWGCVEEVEGADCCCEFYFSFFLFLSCFSFLRMVGTRCPSQPSLLHNDLANAKSINGKPTAISLPLFISSSPFFSSTKPSHTLTYFLFFPTTERPRFLRPHQTPSRRPIQPILLQPRARLLRREDRQRQRVSELDEGPTSV